MTPDGPQQPRRTKSRRKVLAVSSVAFRMISPPSAPKRRRRRIVVAVAVLVLGLCWWHWPRVDQRFVGTWELRTSDRLGQPVREKWRFFASGYGTRTQDGATELRFRWHDKGAELSVDDYWPQGLNGVWLAFMESIRRVSGSASTRFTATGFDAGVSEGHLVFLRLRD
jgi:hypothetical protein